MMVQSSVESTSSEIVAAANLVAAFAKASQSTSETGFSVTGSYGAVSRISLSDVEIEMALGADTPLLTPGVVAEGAVSQMFMWACRSILSTLAYGGGDTGARSRDEILRSGESSGSLRRQYGPSAGVGDLGLFDTSGTRWDMSGTADIWSLQTVPVVSYDALFVEIDRWLSGSRSASRSDEAGYDSELERWFESLKAGGQVALVDRLNLLRSVSEDDDDDDVPLTDESALGLMDFLADVRFDGVRMSVTSVNGWLCTEWTYGDGRSLVLWFKNRVDTMVTSFGRDGKLLAHVGRDPSAGGRVGASELLVGEGFFIWRE